MGNTGSNKKDGSESASPSRNNPFEFSVGASEGLPLVFQNRITSYEKGFVPTVLRWDGDAKEVFISGSFSEWKPYAMAKCKDGFALVVDLPEGEHQFKFLVDGQLMLSSNENTIDDGEGNTNNLITVKRIDLGDDSTNKDSDSRRSPPGSWSQEIPQFTIHERASLSPPVLPPLMKHILNKVSFQNDASILPMPNHVTVNHLFAQSIKDGVFVLSATFRYKEKYITTLLYKPLPSKVTTV